MTDQSACRDFALEIVKRLRQAGYQALWAGGSVRDLILGQTPADYDVATSATPEQVMAALPYRAITVGISFGVVRVRHSRLDGVEVEVATFRSDGAYVDGRRPESVVFGSPELDAARRDFTINGMFMDPLSGEVIDFVGGQTDLKKHVLRAIGDPVARLSEDRLRSLRAIRLAARFQLQIEPATRAALRAMAGQITGVSVERIAQELRRMMVHPSRAKAMKLALETGLVAAILPSLMPMKGLFQGTPMQPEADLWDHTMLVLELLPSDPSFTLAFAALLHDAGKPAAKVVQEGRHAFPHYEQASRQDRRTIMPLAQTIRMPSGSGLPGWSPIIDTWERPGNFAHPSSSESSPILESTSFSPCTRPTHWPRSAPATRSTTAAATWSSSQVVRSIRRRSSTATISWSTVSSRGPASRLCSNSFGTLSSTERFTPSATHSNGSTASSQRARRLSRGHPSPNPHGKADLCRNKLTRPPAC